MSRLSSPPESLSLALNVRTESLGLRAIGRVLGKSHATIIRREQRLAAQVKSWSPPAPAGAGVTLEGDEVYTRVGENLPPPESSGWTIHFTEQETRYWAAAQAGPKTAALFELGTAQAWAWAEPAEFIHWFTDRERRYGKALWQLATVYLKVGEVHPDYGHRKVWRFGLEVAMKIKGSQGRKRVERGTWRLFTALPSG